MFESMSLALLYVMEKDYPKELFACINQANMVCICSEGLLQVILIVESILFWTSNH